MVSLRFWAPLFILRRAALKTAGDREVNKVCKVSSLLCKGFVAESGF